MVTNNLWKKYLSASSGMFKFGWNPGEATNLGIGSSFSSPNVHLEISITCPEEILSTAGSVSNSSPESSVESSSMTSYSSSKPWKLSFNSSSLSPKYSLKVTGSFSVVSSHLHCVLEESALFCSEDPYHDWVRKPYFFPTNVTSSGMCFSYEKRFQTYSTDWNSN